MTTEIANKISFIQNVAIDNKWSIAAYYNKNNKIVLNRSGVKVVINLVNNDVVTTMQHYKYPELTKLKRRGMTMEDVKSVLVNPRVHTDKGEYLEDKVSETEWKPVEGFSTYLINGAGEIKNKNTNVLVKTKYKPGALTASLRRNVNNKVEYKMVNISRLVLKTFKPLSANYHNYTVRFRDGNYSNVNANNLYWKKIERIPSKYGVQLSLFGV